MIEGLVNATCPLDPFAVPYEPTAALAGAFDPR